MKKGYEGSYAVEASFVMAVVLCSMVYLIQAAFGQCRQTTGNMQMQEMVEVLRHKEEKRNSLSKETVPYRIQVERKNNHVEGAVKGDRWSLSVESRVFEPEEFMRLLTLIEE